MNGARFFLPARFVIITERRLRMTRPAVLFRSRGRVDGGKNLIIDASEKQFATSE
jgi:hypothetical protein